MQFRVQHVALHKAGNEPEWYEDAAAFDVVGRFAVSDGAGQGFRCSTWAQLLVRGFAETASPSELDASGVDEWVQGQAQEWRRTIGWDELFVTQQAAAERGAFATWLAVAVAPGVPPDAEGSVPARAAAVGDSCLFQVRGQDLVLAFPLDSPEQFDLTPGLLSSNLRYTARVLEQEQLHVTALALRPGDRLFLATDALACWILTELERGRSPWSEIPLTPAEFAEFVARLRTAGVRNDDMTLVVVDIDEDAPETSGGDSDEPSRRRTRALSRRSRRAQ